MLELSSLESECFYWATRREVGSAWEVVQISTVFGAARDYLSGSFCCMSIDAGSKVMSWSMNWPK